MIRHILIAGLRNMAASKLLSAIAILGLAVGITVALLMGLVVKNQLSYDSFLPGADRTYLAVSPPHPLYIPTRWLETADYRLADHAMSTLPEVEAATRLALTDPERPLKLQRGNVTGWEQLYYADPDAFAVFSLPVLAGELATALRRPDGMAISRAIARKYFGRDDAVGSSLNLCAYKSFATGAMECHSMTVRAVIHDLPANATGLKSGIFVSGLVPLSRLSPPSVPFQQAIANSFNLTYLRLKPDASAAAVERKLMAFLAPFKDNTISTRTSLVPLNRLSLHEEFHPGARQRLAILGITGALVLLVAGINFVNLGVARAARREREVGVRKACGARRFTLMLQFLGEAVIATLFAAMMALAVAESLLPAMNGFLNTGARLDYPSLGWLLLGAIVAIGVMAGAYPAFLLSSFQPAAVLKGWARLSNRGAILRTLLVALQFAVLMVLAISAIVVWRQRDFALHEALRVDTDQMLVLRLNAADTPSTDNKLPLACAPALEDQLRKLSGVRGVACSGPGLFEGLGHFMWDEGSVKFTIASFNAAPELFSLYGLKPLAGALDVPNGTVVNLAAVKMMGFASPEAALGRSWFPGKPDAPWLKRMGRERTIITAVVPDFAFYSVSRRIEPSMYSPWTSGLPGRLIHIKLTGRQLPETLAAVDGAWNAAGMQGPLDRFFVDDHMQLVYRDTTRQAQLFGIFSGVAILLACMGLVGIAVASAERRTKEIGVRKAMGARTWQVAGLLLWQFSLPVLIANLIAWPAAFWLMRRWLAGFVYHIELSWWMFAAASGAALLLALLTVAGQAIRTARQKPVLALRYE